MWYVYILQCADKTLYTGITTNPTRRTQEHNTTDKGAKYTRGRRPVKLVRKQSSPNRSTASQIEHILKALPTKEKWVLIKENKIINL